MTPSGSDVVEYFNLEEKVDELYDEYIQILGKINATDQSPEAKRLEKESAWMGVCDVIGQWPGDCGDQAMQILEEKFKARQKEAEKHKEEEAAIQIKVEDVDAEVDRLFKQWDERVTLIKAARESKEYTKERTDLAWTKMVEEIRKWPASYQDDALKRLDVNLKSSQARQVDQEKKVTIMKTNEPIEKDGLEQLFNMDKEGNTYFNEKILNNLCCQIGKRKVAVISTAGKFRQGKTFWNNILLRGAEKGDARFADHEFIGGKDGFCFKTGYNAHTKGIMVWPKVFSKKHDGEDIAIIILDTQGTFDMETNIASSAVIFAISMLISSTQIFNSSGFLGSNDLDALNVFIDFSKNENERPGQDFSFLMRDIPDEHENGEIYGLNTKYLQSVREKTDTVPALRELLKGIYDAFEKVECCMVPYPEDAVVSSSGKIQAKDCGREFLDTLSNYANHLLANLRPKTFQGEALRGNTFKAYVENLCKFIKSRNCSREIGCAFDATVKLHFERALTAGRTSFLKNCETFVQKNHYQAVSPKVFSESFDVYKADALKAYEAVPRFGGPSAKQQHLKEFTEDIESRIKDKATHNEERYRDCKLANAVNDSYSKYEKGMRPDLMATLQGDNRVQHVKNQHEGARTEAMNHFESEVSEFTNDVTVQVVNQKRSLLTKMIDERYEDLQMNNAIQGVQEVARKVVQQTADKFEKLLLEKLEKVTDNEATQQCLKMARLQLETIYNELQTAVLQNKDFEKLDVNVVKEFLENYKESHLGSLVMRIETQFTSQAHQQIARLQMETKITDMKKEQEKAEEEFTRQKEQHAKVLKNSEKIIEEEKNRARRQIEEANDDREFRMEIQKTKIQMEAKRFEAEQIGKRRAEDNQFELDKLRLVHKEKAAAERSKESMLDREAAQEAERLRFDLEQSKITADKESKDQELKSQLEEARAKREAEAVENKRRHEERMQQLQRDYEIRMEESKREQERVKQEAAARAEQQRREIEESRRKEEREKREFDLLMQKREHEEAERQRRNERETQEALARRKQKEADENRRHQERQEAAERERKRQEAAMKDAREKHDAEMRQRKARDDAEAARLAEKQAAEIRQRDEQMRHENRPWYKKLFGVD